jgi:hypothetical protein
LPRLGRTIFGSAVTGAGEAVVGSGKAAIGLDRPTAEILEG